MFVALHYCGAGNHPWDELLPGDILETEWEIEMDCSVHRKEEKIEAPPWQ
jgi:hypothetical protein